MPEQNNLHVDLAKKFSLSDLDAMISLGFFYANLSKVMLRKKKITF